MTALSPAAQRAHERMERDLRIRHAATESYALIKAIFDRKTPASELAARARRLVQEVEQGQ